MTSRARSSSQTFSRTARSPSHIDSAGTLWKIPNYNLQRAHNANPIFQSVPAMSMWDGLRAVRLKLWDEDLARLVTWADLRRRVATQPRI